MVNIIETGFETDPATETGYQDLASHLTSIAASQGVSGAGA